MSLAVALSGANFENTAVLLLMKKLNRRRHPFVVDQRPLIMFCGPTGVGKDTCLYELLKARSEIVGKAVNFTTRPIREGERGGIDYFFCTDRKFMQMKHRRKFLETIRRTGFRYGTQMRSFEVIWDAGKIPVAQINIDGVRFFRRKFPNSLTIFLAPTKFKQLEKRIRNAGRGKVPECEIKARIRIAYHELSKFYEHCDVALPAATGKIEQLMQKVLLHIDDYIRRNAVN